MYTHINICIYICTYPYINVYPYICIHIAHTHICILQQSHIYNFFSQIEQFFLSAANVLNVQIVGHMGITKYKV